MRYVLITILLAATAHAEEYKIYESNRFGLPSIFPSETIKVDKARKEIKVYKHNEYGLRDFYPSTTIRKEGAAAQPRDQHHLRLREILGGSSPLPNQDQYERQPSRW